MKTTLSKKRSLKTMSDEMVDSLRDHYLSLRSLKSSFTKDLVALGQQRFDTVSLCWWDK